MVDGGAGGVTTLMKVHFSQVLAAAKNAAVSSNAVPTRRRVSAGPPGIATCTIPSPGFDVMPDVPHLPELRHHTVFVVGGQDESLNGVGGYVCRREASEVRAVSPVSAGRLPFPRSGIHHLGMRGCWPRARRHPLLSGDGVDELEPSAPGKRRNR